MKDRPHVVYQVKCLVTGRFYIGSTSNEKQRREDHLSGGRTRPAIMEFEDKHFEVLDRFETIEEAHRREEELLSKYFEDERCVNLSRAAVGFDKETASRAGKISNSKRSLEEKRLIAKRNFKNWRDHTPNWREICAKGAANRDKEEYKKVAQKRGDRLSKQYEVIDPQGNVWFFENKKMLRERFPELKSNGNISSVCNGRLKHYKKFKIRHIEVEF